MPPPATAQDAELSLGTLHSGQLAAYWALRPHRFKALRCGRRFGKTDFAKTWISEGLVRGWECGWFAPQHMTWSEVYSDLAQSLRPILDTSSKGGAVMRMRTGGRLDFWSLEIQSPVEADVIVELLSMKPPLPKMATTKSTDLLWR